MGGLVERFVPRRIRESYLGKFAVVLGTILLVVGLVSLVFYVGLSGMVEEDTRNQLAGNTANQAEELSGWIQANERNARLLSELDVMAEGSQSDIQGTMVDQLRSLPDEVRSVHYVDLENDEIRYSIDPDAQGADLEDLDTDVHVRSRGTLEEVPLTEVGAGDFQTTHSGPFEWQDRRLMAFLSPVGDGSGHAIMITVDLETVGSPFYDPIEGGYTEVVNAGDGRVVMAGEPDRLLQSYGDGPDDEVLQTAGTDPRTLQRDGEILAYATPEESDWVVVSHSPASQAYAVRDTVETTLLVLVGIVLVGFVVLGATMGRETAHALDSLANDARELAGGNLDVEITDSERIDEVGQVENCFRATQRYLRTVAAQAEALADGEFDSDVLDENVPGELGASLDTMRRDLNAYVEEVEASQAEAREAREEAEALAETLQARAEAFGETVGHAADGDLTRRLDEDVDNESMRTIARSFNEMLDELEPTIVDLQTLAETVDEASLDVSTGAEEIDEASDGVADSAEEISAATAEQTERFGEVQDEMAQLSATIEEVASTSDEVAEAAQLAAENTDEVAEQSTAIVEEMQDLEAGAREIATEIEGLDEEIDRINTVVDVIDDIAEQTGILALNASIEAARADGTDGSGDGDGFAVIADEVKALADETAESTEEIESLIDDVRDSAGAVVEDATEMQTRVEESAKRVQSGLASIEEVSDSVDDVSDQVQTVSAATDEQAASAQEVVAMVDKATENSERTHDEAENVAVAVEEQSASTAQVSQTASELSGTAERLRDALDTFEVRDDDSLRDGKATVAEREQSTQFPDTRTSDADEASLDADPDGSSDPDGDPDAQDADDSSGDHDDEPADPEPADEEVPAIESGLDGDSEAADDASTTDGSHLEESPPDDGGTAEDSEVDTPEAEPQESEPGSESDDAEAGEESDSTDTIEESVESEADADD